MGKAADNESIRLRATFYNNLGAGLILTGILLPGMAFTQVGYELGKWIKAWRAGSAAVSYDAMAQGYVVLGAAIIAFLLARLFRSVAKNRDRQNSRLNIVPEIKRRAPGPPAHEISKRLLSEHNQYGADENDRRARRQQVQSQG